MKARLTTYILLAAIVVLSTSCEKWRCIRGNDNRVTETRNLGIFMGVISEGDYEVYIEVDTTIQVPEVEVTADENLLTYIVTQVSGQDLYIKNYDNRCLKSDRPIMINIITPDVDYIELGGSGLLTCDYVDRERFEVSLKGSGRIEAYELQTDLLTVAHTGSGDIELEGRAGEADYTLDGSGRINGYHMELDACYVDLGGSGEVIVWAWDYLEVDLTGSGIVYYRIRPLRTKYNIPGSGQILPF
ncbi:MAG: DUF2807 domain-containing protein [Bacteroidales bacterium]|nr:DUF2807 domain-containing protein [Bacteroidales bacterium]